MISSQQVDARVSADETIRLTSNAGSQYPEYLRRILYTTEEGKKLVFITNDFERPAQAIADLYKMRWQIELFFKWIKQNLKIKRFLGTSKNAVLIQVAVAIIAYLLARLVQQSFPNSLSMQQWARLICVNIFDRKQLESLAKPPPNPTNPPSTQELDLGFA
ncbi:MULTISPECIES: transposase [Nitrosomonas]|uniref:DDE family transposase n=1 Tax=Nitrosomonas communis TaxID=44574 RepID=A0A5D3Y7T8_9PROT|nr:MULTISPECIES: transposase [Nitrosomonas]TYP78330.1 DDE family transposase [Nitrosomonas communis]UVS60285.1 transposase [Nitrosomonas sp. PLL12]